MKTLNSLSNLELRKLAEEDYDYVDVKPEDFDPPMDTRRIRSGIMDLDDGNTFEEFTEEFFERYADDLFDE